MNDTNYKTLMTLMRKPYIEYIVLIQHDYDLVTNHFAHK